jgi:predicted ABC-type ATPase
MAAELLAGVTDVAQFVDADVFARELSRSPSQADAIEAGRAMLRRLDELAGENLSFGFETTQCVSGATMCRTRPCAAATDPGCGTSSSCTVL